MGKKNASVTVDGKGKTAKNKDGGFLDGFDGLI